MTTKRKPALKKRITDWKKSKGELVWENEKYGKRLFIHEGIGKTFDVEVENPNLWTNEKVDELWKSGFTKPQAIKFARAFMKKKRK